MQTKIPPPLRNKKLHNKGGILSHGTTLLIQIDSGIKIHDSRISETYQLMLLAEDTDYLCYGRTRILTFGNPLKLP